MINHLINRIKEDRTRPICVLIVNNHYHPILITSLIVRGYRGVVKVCCNKQMMFSISFNFDLTRINNDYYELIH